MIDLLLNQSATVQPWYVMDSGRRSTKRELQAMKEIREALEAKDPSVAERFLPTKIFKIEDIPADTEVTSAYERVASRYTLGRQYEWLARLARSQQVTLELGVHRDDKFHNVLGAEIRPTGTGSYSVAGTSDPDLTAFANFEFPIFDMTKIEMQHFAEKYEFDDIMEMTWFCFSPLLDGKPCGFCNPCRYTREEGLGRRVPARSRTRRAHHIALKVLWKVRTTAMSKGK
ncbi:7-cyano-7-deazaguanine synthase [Arthrobacter sp. NPDC097144]|uniref:7-cyano-7-deazaguanine synthase n=1 Tax=Arthrobacter sp. NPDC097144 TaxID=3363946 RepID=UPI00380115B0